MSRALTLPQKLIADKIMEKPFKIKLEAHHVYEILEQIEESNLFLIKNLQEEEQLLKSEEENGLKRIALMQDEINIV
jgi:hypothetical protein